MAVQRFGKIRKLRQEETRQLWPREEQNLSPWLVENVDVLNEVLHRQIELDSREESVENFRLDLAGTDMLTQRPVIVENQFGRSDHDHLGKLITYAAGKEAGVMIWIANEIQGAHRAAIEWLNKISPPEMSFNAIELEVLQIDQSLPAPYLRVVAGPILTGHGDIGPGAISARNKRYQDFFEQLRGNVLALRPNITRAKAVPWSYWSFGAGRSGFFISAAFTIDSRFRVELYLDTGVKESNDLAFGELKQKQAHIEEEVGTALVWDALPDSRACRIYTAVDGNIDDTEEHLVELKEWAAPLLVRFRDTFSPLTRNIQFPEMVTEAS